MEKVSKGELKAWAHVFDQVICYGLAHTKERGASLHFSYNGMEMLTADELETRLKTVDPELARRFRAWHDATYALGTYAHSRLEGRE